MQIYTIILIESGRVANFRSFSDGHKALKRLEKVLNNCQERYAQEDEGNKEEWDAIDIYEENIYSQFFFNEGQIEVVFLTGCLD